MICQCQFCNTLWSRKWRWTHTSPLDSYLNKSDSGIIWHCPSFLRSYLTLRKKGNWRSKEGVWSWSKATSILQFRSFSSFFLREHPWHSVKARELCVQQLFCWKRFPVCDCHLPIRNRGWIHFTVPLHTTIKVEHSPAKFQVSPPGGPLSENYIAVEKLDHSQ